MNTPALKKNIMRDVYTAYAIHMSTRPVTRYAVLTLVLGYVLAKLVFVAAIIANAEAVGLAKLPEFAFGALTHTSVLTLGIFVLMCVVAVMSVLDVVHPYKQQLQAVRA